jgi:hypothetical protein
MQVPWKALALRLGPKADDAAAFVVSKELEPKAGGIFDAAYEAHAGIGPE